MKTSKIVRAFSLSNLAEHDLEKIGIYTQEIWGEAQRYAYFNKMNDAFQEILAAPLLGKESSDIHLGYWRKTVGQHFIFYEFDEDKLRIIRTLHHKMDIVQHLDNDSSDEVF